MEQRNGEHRLRQSLNVLPTIHFDDVDAMPDTRVKQLDIFLLGCSIIMHVVDMCFDYNIAIQYLLNGKKTYFIWTICFILIPSLINVLVSERMQHQDREKNPSMDMLDDRKTTRLMIKNKLFFLLAIPLQLAPIVHYWETLKYALKARRCEKSGDRVGERRYYLRMLKEDQDVALLRVFECYLEAAPQHILQLTLILKHYDNRINLEFIHQAASVVSSLVSMGWAMASYHRSIRLAQQDKSNIGTIGIILQFLWHFFITVARILSLSIIASIWSIYTIICCIIHWIGMIIWILVDSKGILEFCRTYSLPPHMQPSIKERIYSVLFASVIGIVHIFIYLNIVDGNTFWKHLCFYSLCLLENITSNFLWKYTCPPAVQDAWYFNVLFIICIFSFFLGISAMLLYYTVFHPSKKHHTSNAVQVT